MNIWHLLWIVPAAAFVGLIAEGLLKEADKNSKWKSDIDSERR